MVLSAMIAWECTSDHPTQHQSESLRLAPLADENAELLALYLSGETEAPLPLYQRIHGHLERIRADYDSLVALDSIAFHAPWVPSFLSVTADSEALEHLLGAGNPVWDSLDAIYQPTVYKTRRLVQFPGRLHPERLADAYREVEALGNVYLEHGTMSWAIYTHQIYPTRIDADSIVYLFHRGDGFPFDPVPIGGNEFWCFFAGEQGVHYAGSFYKPLSRQFQFPPTGHSPDWWVTVCPTVLEFTGLPESWCE